MVRLAEFLGCPFPYEEANYDSELRNSEDCSIQIVHLNLAQTVSKSSSVLLIERFAHNGSVISVNPNQPCLLTKTTSLLWMTR